MFESRRPKVFAAALLLAAAGLAHSQQEPALGAALEVQASPNQKRASEAETRPSDVPGTEQAPAPTPVPAAVPNSAATGAVSFNPPPLRRGILQPHQHHLEVKREFETPPLGYFIGLHFQAQVNNGIAARMILHDYDFLCNTAQLNVRGKDRLLWIARELGHTTHPLVIERTPCFPGLAEMRRTAILHELEAIAVTLPPELVVIGPLLAIPQIGAEAELIYLNLLHQTQEAGRGAGRVQPISGTSTTSTSSGR
jgi:hypothetical protein